MPGMFYYRHVMTDYDKETKALSLLEHGAYRRLMDAYYANGGPLDADESKLFRAAGAFTPTEQDAVRHMAARFLVREGDRLVKAGWDEEIARVAAESERQQAKARARWDKPAESAAAHAAASATAKTAARPKAKAKAGAAAMPVKSQESSQELLPPTPFVLPDWVPKEQWGDYLQMRLRIRKPPTERAKQLAVNELAKLRDEGYDPLLVLEQSTLNSWQGLFPLRNGGRSRRSETEARNDHTADTWADR